MLNDSYGQRILAGFPNSHLTPAPMDCVRLDLKRKVTANFAGAVNNMQSLPFGKHVLIPLLQVYLVVNVTHSNYILIYLSTRNASFLPTSFNLYGGLYDVIKFYGKGSRFVKTYDLGFSIWNMMNNPPTFNCDDTGKPVHPENCINGFIEKEVGCSSTAQTAKPTKALCSKRSEYAEWTKWVQTIMKLNEEQIYRRTGCLGSCHADEYRIIEGKDLTVSNRTDSKTDKRLRLRFMFPSAYYQVKEEYAVYNFDSFIADVGGYMGLLLGQSIFSIVCSFWDISSHFKIPKKKDTLK